MPRRKRGELLLPVAKNERPVSTTLTIKSRPETAARISENRDDHHELFCANFTSVLPRNLGKRVTARGVAEQIFAAIFCTIIRRKFIRTDEPAAASAACRPAHERRQALKSSKPAVQSNQRVRRFGYRFSDLPNIHPRIFTRPSRHCGPTGAGGELHARACQNTRPEARPSVVPGRGAWPDSQAFP